MGVGRENEERNPVEKTEKRKKNCDVGKSTRRITSVERSEARDTSKTK